MRRLSLTLVPRRSCISLSTSPFVVVGVAHALANWLHSPWLWIHRSLLVKIKWNSMAEYVYYIYYQRIIGYVWWLGTYPAGYTVCQQSTINNTILLLLRSLDLRIVDDVSDDTLLATIAYIVVSSSFHHVPLLPDLKA